MIETSQGKYVVPSGKGVGPPLILDIISVVQAESRLQEVAFVNMHTAPELLSTFNKCWLDLDNSVTRLIYEKACAQDTHERLRSEALLNCTDESIKQRGHSKASADLREAMVSINPTVIEAKERLNEIVAVLNYLQSKKQAFENAFTSVKRLVSGQQLPTQPLRDRPQPSVEAPRKLPGGYIEVPHTTVWPAADEIVSIPGFVEPVY